MYRGTRADFQGSVGALDNLQQILAQLLINRKTNDMGSNHNEEEHNDDECPKTEKSKESSSIDVEVVKGMLRSDCIPNPKR